MSREAGIAVGKNEGQKVGRSKDRMEALSGGSIEVD